MRSGSGACDWHEARLPNEAMGSKYSVMARSLKRVSTAMIALVTAAGWFLAANHCVVACLAAPLDAEAESHKHCGDSSETPTDQERSNDCESRNCCKSLSAPASFAKKL